MAKKKDELVPYDQVSPGFEAVYTGETSSTPARENEMGVATFRRLSGVASRHPEGGSFPDRASRGISSILRNHR